jgi:tetratricopeptide (TPR) repeat protein
MPRTNASSSGSQPGANLRAVGSWACIAVIAAATVLAWSNSFNAPFHLDDHPSIVANATIRDFGSFNWITPPATAGETVSGRPVLNFTFAVNHALGGLDVRGYHVGNVIIHALAALTLFGVVRRTLGLLRGRSPLAEGPERSRWAGESPFPSRASSLLPPNLIALSVALLWAVHPLHTGAVTYVVQRAESLCGLFYLLTLYCIVRGVGRVTEQPSFGNRQVKDLPDWSNRLRLWFIAAVVSCLLAVGTKEVAASAPLVVLLFDRTFLAGSFREALRVRWRIHAALVISWIPLAILVLTNRGRGGSAGLGTELDSWTYLLTQAGAIVHYLRLSVWPNPLVFDHGTSLVSSFGEVWWQASAVLVLLVSSFWAILRKPRSGFLAATFFLLLAPSSSFMPVATQTVAEHRMYLPLAVLVAVAMLGVRRALETLAARRVIFGGLVAAVAIALGATTFVRNRVYLTELTLWEDTAAKRPNNPRARNNLGMAYSSAGRIDDAIAEFQRAIALQPNHAFAHFNLAVLLTGQEKWDAAVMHCRAALAADAGYVSARVNLGELLVRLGQTEEAIEHLQAALAIDPDAHDARTALAALLIRERRAIEAVPMLRSVIAAVPEFAEAQFHLGRALEQSGGSASAADAAYREAVRLKPEFAAAHLAIGNRLVKRGDASGAERSYREAIRLDAHLAEARFALGNIFAGQKKFDSAMAAYREALAIEPAHAQALNNLGNCQLVTGRFQDAAVTYEQVIRLRPDDETVMKNLELARELQRTGAPRGN